MLNEKSFNFHHHQHHTNHTNTHINLCMCVWVRIFFFYCPIDSISRAHNICPVSCFIFWTKRFVFWKIFCTKDMCVWWQKYGGKKSWSESEMGMDEISNIRRAKVRESERIDRRTAGNLFTQVKCFWNMYHRFRYGFDMKIVFVCKFVFIKYNKKISTRILTRLPLFPRGPFSPKRKGKK